MQIRRNLRSNKTFFQLIPARLLCSLPFIMVLMFSACTQHKIETLDSATGILPVADNTHLPDVIKTLLAQSDKQFSNNDLTGSLATLERALRINPKYAEVWSRMAVIYLKQGKYEQARQHAKRSNSVIKNNTELKAFNHKIINVPTQEN